MAHGLSNVSGYVSRRDLFYVDPRTINVIGGFNPRNDFTGEEELKISIINMGVLEPLEVRKTKDNILELVDGERRLRATLKAIDEGHEIISIPVCLVPQATNEIDLLVRALTRNTGKPLTPVEEAQSFKRLVNYGWEVKKIAEFIGRSVPYVYKRLELCGASKELEKAINDKEITIAEAQSIIKVSDGKIEEQKQKIEEKKFEREETSFIKDAVKAKLYSDDVMEYLEYKETFSKLSKDVLKLFKIKDDTLDFKGIHDRILDMIDFLQMVVSEDVNDI